MRIIITKDYEEMSAKAFEIMKGVVKNNPYAVLGLATGTTPLGLYRRMIEDHKEHGTSYAHIRAANLDEYKGLPKDHPQSYAYFMRENLFRHLDIEESNTFIENGIAKDENLQDNRMAEMEIERTILIERTSRFRRIPPCKRVCFVSALYSENNHRRNLQRIKSNGFYKGQNS